MMTHVQAMAAEAQRRLKLLGATKEDTTGSLVGVRARQVGVSALVLRRWPTSYLRGGLDGLLPTDWPELASIHLGAYEVTLRSLQK